MPATAGSSKPFFFIIENENGMAVKWDWKNDTQLHRFNMKRCQALLSYYPFSFPLPLFSWGFHAMGTRFNFQARVPRELPPTYRIRSTSTDLKPLHACYSLFSGAYHCERQEQHWIEIQYQEKWTPRSCYLFLFSFLFFLVQFTPQPTQRYSIFDTQKKKIDPSLYYGQHGVQARNVSLALGGCGW